MDKIQAGVILLLVLVLYLPTLSTGFLTDDFLDAQTTFSESSKAFTTMLSSGYRPLMSFSWAIDNWIWGTGRQWAWHLTNLIILAGTLFSLRSFLKLFVKDRKAVLAGLALFAFCTPVAVAVAKTDYRTSLLPLLPLLWSMYFLIKYTRKERGFSALILSSLFLLVSVFLKEIALAIPPAFAVLAWSQAQGTDRTKAVLKALVAATLPVVAYLVTRYLTVGFALGYSQSSTFGFFVLKNILLLMGKVWTPWLSSLPARILLPFFGIALFIIPAEKKLKIFLAVFSFFILLTVGNLSPRVDYAVSIVPVFALSLSLLVQRYSSRKFLAAVVLALSAVFLSSFDEIKLIKVASDSLREQTARIIEISKSFPGNGPLFLVGVEETSGGWGTFWHGEYTIPIEYSGENPGRIIHGPDRIWQMLIEAGQSGYLIFLYQNGGYCSYPVSSDMYSDLPDTTVLVTGPVMTDSLTRYPTCIAAGSDDKLVLVSSILPGFICEVSSIQHDGGWYFDLAAVPLWLSGDSAIIIISNKNELVFTDRRIAEELALEVIVVKNSVRQSDTI